MRNAGPGAMVEVRLYGGHRGAVEQVPDLVADLSLRMGHLVDQPVDQARSP